MCGPFTNNTLDGCYSLALFRSSNINNKRKLFGISVIYSLITLYSTGIIVARGVQSELFAGVRLGSERLGGKGQRAD